MRWLWQYWYCENFTNICPLPMNEICFDNFATRYVRCTCFCNTIWQCWSKIVLTICKNDEYCIFCFSIVIFCYKNKCIVHISLRRYPSISPTPAEDKYSWSFIVSKIAPFPHCLNGDEYRRHPTQGLLDCLHMYFSFNYSSSVLGSGGSNPDNSLGLLELKLLEPFNVGQNIRGIICDVFL